MELTQIKGNTWVLKGNAWIPLYRVGNDCILLDSGLPQEREKLENALKENNLNPIGVLCTHAHIDHCGSSAYFQKKYQIPFGISVIEAGMLKDSLNMKVYRIMSTPGQSAKDMADVVTQPEVEIPLEDGTITFAGVEFGVHATPGHSSGHLCFTTPDGVCYLGDALMTADLMESKLPYALDVAKAIQSQQKLLQIPAEIFVFAHTGQAMAAEMPDLVAQNTALFQKRGEEILSLLDEPKFFDQLAVETCAMFELKIEKPQRVLYFQRNVRLYLEYLQDQELVEPIIGAGGVMYQRCAKG